MEFPRLLLFKPVTSLVQTTFSNWDIFQQLKTSTELLIAAILMQVVSLPPKDILLRSITRNTVTERPKRGLETRIYLALRNNLVLGREKQKSRRHNFCDKTEVWKFVFLSYLKNRLQDFFETMYTVPQVVRLFFENHAPGRDEINCKNRGRRSCQL